MSRISASRSDRMQVSELVPKRPPIARVGGGAARATADFDAQIFSIAMVLLEEYRKFFGIAESGNPEDVRSSKHMYV